MKKEFMKSGLNGKIVDTKGKLNLFDVNGKPITELQIRNGVLDLSPLSVNTLPIAMTGDRLINFELAYEVLAEQWQNGINIPQVVNKYLVKNNIEITQITESLVKKMLKGVSSGGVGLTIHEAIDGTIMLIPTAMHNSVKHFGGRALYDTLSSMPDNLRNILKEILK